MLCGGLDAIPPMTVVDLIDVRFQNLRLRVDVLDLLRDTRFLQLAREPFTKSDLFGKHVACELLRNRAAAARHLATQNVADCCAKNPPVVETIVRVEALVLDGNECLRHIRRKCRELDWGAPLLEELGNELAVLRKDLGRALWLPRIDLRDGRAI